MKGACAMAEKSSRNGKTCQEKEPRAEEGACST